MKSLKANVLFTYYNNFTIDKNANIYLERSTVSTGNEVAKNEIVVFNSNLEEINSFSYQSVIDYLKTTKNQDSFLRFYVTHDDLFIIGTQQNRVFVLNFEGQLLNSYYEKDIALIDDFKGSFIAQKNHFAASFFNTQDHKILTLTHGYFYGKINKRGRFIISISKEQNPSFLDKEPFPTRYINDVWSNIGDIPPVWYKNLDTTNVKFPNIWHELEDFSIHKKSFFSLINTDIEEYFKKIHAHKLGNPTRNYKFYLGNLMINQVIELNETQILATIFIDGQSKASKPTVSTCYYFLILDKTTGAIIKDISPNDTTIYKNHSYLVVDDKINERLIFKTHENLYFINYQGEIYKQLSLKDRKLSRFRNLSYLGIENKISFFYDFKSNKIYSVALGKFNSQIEILNFVNDFKK
jgi:hypothetical protein